MGVAGEPVITDIIFEENKEPCPSVDWLIRSTNEECKENIEKLFSYCASKDIDVRFENVATSYFSPRENNIVLSSKFGPKNTYYTFLHEIGHALVSHDMGIMNKKPIKFFVNYPGYVGKNGEPYQEEGSISKKDYNRYMTSLIHEEMDAWRKGIDIAGNLGLPLDLYEYWNFASECIDGYIDYKNNGYQAEKNA